MIDTLLYMLRRDDPLQITGMIIALCVAFLLPLFGLVLALHALLAVLSYWGLL